MGSHQVASEHSILSAQGNISDAAMEFREEPSVHNEPEWLPQLEEIKQFWKRRTKGDGRRSRRDHAPCRRRRRSEELSEKDYEIYLDMKLQWSQQFYVTAKSRATGKEAEKEPEEEERIEDFKADLKFHELEEVVKPVTHKGMVGNESTDWEAKGESKKNVNGDRGRVTVEQDDGDEDDSDEDDVKEELPPAEPPLKESSVEELDSGATVEEVFPDRGLRERTLSLVTELCDEEVMEVAGRNVGDEEGQRDGSGREQSPEKPSLKPPESELLLLPNVGATMVELQHSHNLGELFLSLSCLSLNVGRSTMLEPMNKH